MNRAKGLRSVWVYALLSWPLVLAQLLGFLRGLESTGKVTPVFIAAAWLTYGLIYLLPAAVLTSGLLYAVTIQPVRRTLERACIRPSWVVYTVQVLAFSLSQVIIFADRFIYRLYDFHLNGFVWNLLSTRGGIESLGGSTRTNVSFGFIIAGIVLVQAALLAVVVAARPAQRVLEALCTRRKVIAFIAILVSTSLLERFTYGLSNIRHYTPVLAAGDALPFYLPTTFNSLAKRFGYKVDEEDAAGIKVRSGSVLYPVNPITRQPVGRPLNIVWLVSESLRADALDPVIMPKTSEFAAQAMRFEQHYSGGNGTRMAMFSMFYGLYGSYWFNFLHQQRGPVLMDELIDANYQMKLFTSAKFTYPEFDKTIFARVPAELLHEGDAQPKWRRDRENVALLLDFIEHRDPSRPFMTFMFFESPHANYYFSQDNIVRKPYAEDLNYATMDLAKDIGLIKARYDNACNHLDSQLDRVISYLRDHKLLDSTIVLITGDHGEEFMEKGHWGHNNGYSQEQTRVPMVLWIPGEPPRTITRMTSHLDVPATILPRLGVTNPPEDYSLGHDMLGEPGRDYTVLCDWNNLCIVDGQYKAVFPTSGYSWRGRKLTTRDDRPVEDSAGFYQTNSARMVEVMHDLKRFAR